MESLSVVFSGPLCLYHFGSFRLVRRDARAKSVRFYLLLFAFNMGPSRSSSLRIDGDSLVVPRSGRTRGVPNRSAAVELRDAPRALPLPLDKGKGRVNLIEYPGGSDYLKSTV